MQTPLTVAEIYKAIFAGQKVTVAVPLASFNSLRVAISKRHYTPKMLDLTDESVCARYNKDTSEATFWLGKRTRVPQQFTVTRIDDA